MGATSLSSDIALKELCACRARVISHDLGEPLGEGRTLFNLGSVLWETGERDSAVAHAEAALEILEKLGDPTAASIRKQLRAWRESN